MAATDVGDRDAGRESVDDAVERWNEPYSVTHGAPSVLLWNDGHANFTVDGELGGQYFHHVRLGDLDGDGDLDAVVARWDWSEEPPIQVWLQR